MGIRNLKSAADDTVCPDESECYAKTTSASATTPDIPCLPVIEHLRHAGLVACALLNKLPNSVRSLLPEYSAVFAATHDIGKVSPGFQLNVLRKKALSHYLAHTNHAEASEAAVTDFLRSLKFPSEQIQLQPLISGYHHGRRTSLPRDNTDSAYGNESWSHERLRLIKKMGEEFGSFPDEISEKSLPLLCGLTCLADWIASDEQWFNPLIPPLGSSAADAANRAVTEAGWNLPLLRKGQDFMKLFGDGFTPNAFQSAAYAAADRPGLYILEAPMGLGKTEAALWAAYRLMEDGYHHGLYFALPTRLTSNRIHQRVGAFLNNAFAGGPQARLVHGGAWMQLPLGGGEELRPGHGWFSPLKRALLQPFGVGTVDQALLGVMNAKHFFLRLFGLAGKAVILDEVHSYDLYTGTLLDSLVKTLLGLNCSVFILSATLTAERIRSFLPQSVPADKMLHDYPKITSSREFCDVIQTAVPPPDDKTVELRNVSISAEVLLAQAAQQALSGAQVLWICNTVKDAQNAYRKANSLLPDNGTRCGLLHSRFLPWRREELEAEWMQALGKQGARACGAILLATQVVEQSVDIDADVLYSDLAPSDMLLQRIGRLWRHNRVLRPLPRPTAVIRHPAWDKIDSLRALREEIGGTAAVYAPYVLWRSGQIWSQLGEIRLPGQIREIIEETYSELPNDAPVWVEDAYRRLLKERNALRQHALAVMSQRMLPLNDDEEVLLATRYGNRRERSVLVLAECPEGWSNSRFMGKTLDGREITLNRGRPSREQAIAANLNCLRIPDYSLHGLRSPWWAEDLLGNGALGLVINIDGVLHTPEGEATIWRYSNELGLYQQKTENRNGMEAADEFDW